MLREIERIKDATNDLRSVVIPDDHLVDVVGDTETVYRALGAVLRDLKAELDAGAVGERWESTKTRSATRTYNTNGLLSAFAQAFPGAQTPAGALQRLVEHNVVTLGWRWTELQKAADRYDVTLPVAKHEIGDGDPSVLVGEVWRSRVQVRAVEPEVT